MPYYLCVLLALNWFAAPVYATTHFEAPSFFSRHGASVVLKQILKQRCAFYFGRFNENGWQCRETVDLMVTILDQDFHINSRGLQSAISFRGQLLEFIRRPEVQHYLQATNEALRTHSSHNPFLLWQDTLAQTNGDASKALQWIALLFQDSDAFAHVAYLRSHGGPSLQPQLQLLAETNELLATSPGTVLYPGDIRSQARSQYHFYVIAYLVHRLEALQPHSFLNQLVPFLFNATYSYLRYIAGSDWTTRWRLVADPWNGFNSDTHNDSLEDIYLGFAAASWAVPFNNCPVDQSQFSPHFARSPDTFIRNWIASRLGVSSLNR